jgi:hypothetical protein
LKAKKPKLKNAKGSRFGLRKLEGQETKTKKYKRKQRNCKEPNFGGPFTQWPFALPIPMMASERVWASFSPPHTRLEEVEMTHIFKYGYLHFHKQGGTKEFPHLLLYI